MPPLIIHTLYDHPSDYPDNIVVRRWAGNIYLPDVLLFDDLDSARKRMREMGLMRVAADVNDDPVIIECWL